MKSRAFFTFFFLFLTVPTKLLFSSTDSSQTRVPWTLDEDYSGSYRNSFEKLRYEIPILIRQTMINISVKLGLDFNEGWAHPLIIRFVDESPMNVENVLAYVQYLEDREKGVFQTLNINLKAYEREGFDFNKVFAHELVHAMLNDAMGPESLNVVPVWLHEGLAVFGADQGEQMVKAYVLQNASGDDDFFLNGLEGPHGAIDYAEDYLALKYIHQTHGITSLHNFVREIIQRKGDILGALEYTCFENWAKFQTNARAFSIEEVRKIKHEKKLWRSFEKPF